MSKVITFSRTFPAYHPKAGQPTYFVEKLVNTFMELGYPIEEIDQLCHDAVGLDCDIKEFKHHTIRAGNRWKVGDKFSPRVWGGRPYYTPQVILSEDIEIKKLWNFYFDKGLFKINEARHDGETEGDHELLEIIAINDGLEVSDFKDWFQISKGKTFSGQIICWNDKIEYR